MGISNSSNAHNRAIQENPNSVEESRDCGTYSQVEDALREVQSLERQQYTKSRFRRLARRLEPLIDFLIVYAPTVDMLVQYDVNPSAVVWGSLKTLIKASNPHLSKHFFGWLIL